MGLDEFQLLSPCCKKPVENNYSENLDISILCPECKDKLSFTSLFINTTNL